MLNVRHRILNRWEFGKFITSISHFNVDGLVKSLLLQFTGKRSYCPAAFFAGEFDPPAADYETV